MTQDNTTHNDNPAQGNAPPTASAAAVLKPSQPLPGTPTVVRGPDLDAGPLTIDSLLASMATTGFQASALADAVRIINGMIDWRSPADPAARTTVFLGYTSNLVSSGLREVIRWLVQHRHVAAIVTTAGGVEEDIIKTLGPTYVGSFAADGAGLRARGINRIGNLLVPNDNYCAFEDWVMPVLDSLLDEQDAENDARAARNAARKSTDPDREPLFTWRPSTITARLGAALDHDDSILTWAARNDIPVFCPALTDGSLGDMLDFHSFKASPRELVVDIRGDIRRINDISRRAAHAGIVILGGGLVKHHIANACLMRDGADKAVYINTGSEMDGSDAGARPDEAVSWGKIRSAEDGGESVKVWADATLVFPLIVAGTWASAARRSNKAG